MSQKLSAEEAAVVIRAKKILKARGLSPDTDVKTICQAAGISRKTGYQRANKAMPASDSKEQELREQLEQLKAKHEALKKRFDDVRFENEGRKIAWEIHEVDKMLAKKKHYGQNQKQKAISFFRIEDRPLREAAWVLAVSTSTLSGWNQSFDENMKPLKVADNRGKASKLTIEIVRRVCEKAKGLKQQAKRIRLKQFTNPLQKEDAIYLSAKTVNEILIANDLAAAQSRKKRPRFYQSLCQRIPNGLLSLDGSEFTIWLDNMPFTFNLELAVDVGSFTHTAFSIADTETTDEVIGVLEAHRRQWGTPVGVVCDHGSANLSENAMSYIKSHGIELVPAGPANPKGNGTDEGAFGQMKNTLGVIRLDMSSPKALAKSVLNALVSVYVYLRNRLCLHNNDVMPIGQMAVPVSRDQRKVERQRLKEHQKTKTGSKEDQLKLDHLQWIIDHFGFEPEADVLHFCARQYSSPHGSSIGRSNYLGDALCCPGENMAGSGA